MTRLDRLAQAVAERTPDRPALLTARETVTYGELEARIQACAEHLAGLGLRAGHKAAVTLGTSPDMIVQLLGALRQDLMVSVISTAFGEAERELRRSAFDPDHTVSAAGDTGRPGGDRRPPSGCPGTVVFWTSGSTGRPKGVVLDQAALLWNAVTNAGVMGLHADDRALVILDGAYCYAMVHQVFSHLAVGGSLRLPEPPVWLPSLAPTLERGGVTTLAVVPSMLKALLGFPAVVQRMAGVRLLTVGGATCPEPLLGQAQAVLPRADIRVTYGLAEAGPRVCTRRYQAGGRDAPGSVGHPLPGVELSLSAQGELLVRSPSVCRGEWVDGKLEPGPDWVHTGDLATIEPTGAVRIRGRLKSLIKRGGIRILPAEIERALCSHPGVLEAKVVGIRHPRLGEVPKAYIVPVAGARLEAGSLASFCLDRLRITSVPVEIDLVPKIPNLGQGWKDV